MNLIRTTVADGRVIYLNFDHLSHAIRTPDHKIAFILAAPGEDVEVVTEGAAAEELETILDAFVLTTLRRLDLQTAPQTNGHAAPSQRTVLPFTTPPKDFPEAIP